MITAMVPSRTSSELEFVVGSPLFPRHPRTYLVVLGRSLTRQALVCAAGLVTLAAPCFAQKTGHAPSGGGGGAAPVGSPGPVMGQPGNTYPQPYSTNQSPFPSNGDPFAVLPITTPGLITVNSDSARAVEAEACNSWTDSGVHSPTVSLARLQVPDKASSEFQKGCSAYKSKKLSDAEQHVRKALDIYPQYAASWVLLGQVLDAEHHSEDAGKACSQGATVDPKYIAPYLCLAEFAARNDDWKQVSQLSDEALAIDPTSNAYALYYSANADFHLQKNLPDAEQHARAAVDLDPWHHLPQLHLLLASIYAGKNDPHAEESELKEFLKVASSSPDAPTARVMLKHLQTPPVQDSQPQNPSASSAPAQSAATPPPAVTPAADEQ